MAIRRIVLASVALAALAGCGSQQDLQLATGQKPPVKPAMAAKAPTPLELLEPQPIARPDRVTEILKRSQQREEDRFDLPPPG
jgi:hypothetical protein